MAERDNQQAGDTVNLTFHCIDGQIPLRVPVGVVFDLPEAERIVSLLVRWRCFGVEIQPGRPGVSALVPLTNEQVEGLACVRCGSTSGRLQPLARINGGQVVFACQQCPTRAYVLEPFVSSSDVRTRI